MFEKVEFIWFVLGIIGILLEFILPGGIVIFPGIAAVIVGSLLHFGVITSQYYAMIIWLILSIILLFTIRQVFIKYFEGDSHIDNTDEDIDAIGSIVEVIEDCDVEKIGRIKFRGTTWEALGESKISRGDSAHVIARNDNTWIIKKIEES